MFDRIEVASPSRPWATVLAFLINLTALTLAVVFPLVKPEQLPALNFRMMELPYIAPHVEVREEAHAQPVHLGPIVGDSSFRAPSSIPKSIDMSAEEPTQIPGTRYIPGTEGLGPTTGVPGIPWGATSNPPPIPLVTKPPRPKTLVISHLDEGMLIRRVQPVYPPLAKLTHTEGTVILSALISPKGEVEGLQVLSGPPLLVEAALAAVRQWHYRPYILNGEPIEVRTQVTVHFTLQ